jgi:hypothetical protein
MATVVTTTQADSLSWPGQAGITARYVNATTMWFYAAVRTGTDTLTIYRSTNNGGSWASITTLTHTGLQEWGSLIWETRYLYLAYRTGDGTSDRLHYWRWDLDQNSFSSILVRQDANGGTPGNRWTGVDMVVHRTSGTSVVAAIAGHYSSPSEYGVVLFGTTINRDTFTINNGLFAGGRRAWYASGSSPGRSGVAIELEHNGDGITAQTPNLWVTWGREFSRMVKCAWTGSGWIGPSGSTTMRNPIVARDFAAIRWDGDRCLIPAVPPDDSSQVRIYQRNKANTTTASIDTPTHPQGVIRFYALSQQASTRNLRVFAVGTGNNTLYYVDYNRTAGTWSSWSQVSASAIANSGAEWSVRRGGTHGDSKHTIIYSVSGSPNTVTAAHLNGSAAPAVPRWVTSGQAYTNGSAANVGLTVPLAWTFTDIDFGGAQGSYAISRQIGAGSVQYWNAGTSSWGASEVQNTSSTPAATLPASWGTAGDPAHQYKVKVWDSQGSVAPGYSSALVIYPSAPVNPTITAPTAAQVLNAARVTVSWTVAAQTGYRIDLTYTGPGQAALVWSSGDQLADTSTSVDIPYLLDNGSGYTITLYTYNNEGLRSAGITRAFTTQYQPPAAAGATFAPSTTSGHIAVTATNPTPVGAQPVVSSQDLWRRRRITTTVLNTNPSFAGNTTGWQVGGGGSGALTYSTAQAKDGPGAGRYVPTGNVAAPSIESSAATTVTAGVAYTASGWIRPDTAAKPITIALGWYLGGSLLGSTTRTVTVPVAAAWQYLEVTGDNSAFPTATSVRAAIGEASTPQAADAFYADLVQLRVANADTGALVVEGIASGGTVFDAEPASGVDYEYRWATHGVNATTIAGPWTG